MVTVASEEISCQTDHDRAANETDLRTSREHPASIRLIPGKRSCARGEFPSEMGRNLSSRAVCSATGDCQILCNSAGEWINLFNDEAPVASGFSFLREAHSGHKDFVLQPTARRIPKIMPFTISTASSIVKPKAT